MEITYLEEGVKRPPGDKSPLIECIRGKRGRGMEIVPGGGIIITVGPEFLNDLIAEMDKKGECKVYVRLPAGQIPGAGGGSSPPS